MNFKANESQQKLSGAYYTPFELANFLTEWALNGQTKSVLEPSIGDGVFIEAIKSTNHKIESLTGIELNKTELTKAKNKSKDLNFKSTFHAMDFLSWALMKFNKMRFGAVLGNPPFVRYQYMDKESQLYSESIFKYFSLKFTKHTNLWVPFVLASVGLLKDGGRLAMVVPSEILYLTHSQSLRDFLIDQSYKILIIDPEEIWFKDTLQGAVLLLLEKRNSEKNYFSGLKIIASKGNAFLKDKSIIQNKTDLIKKENLNGKWLKALLEKKEISLLAEIRKSTQVEVFSDIAKVDVGIVTGVNKYFLVNDDVIKKYKLQKWAYPMFGRSEHCPGIIYNQAQHETNKLKNLPTNFLYFKDTDISKYSESVKEYIELGEEENYHTRYKTSIRKPWFKVPSVYSTKIGLLKRCHNIPRLIYNEVDAYTTDTAYRISTKGIESKQFVYSFINTLTAVSAELEGRHYGGGVLELIPSEIEKLLIPLIPQNKVNLEELNAMFLEKIEINDILKYQDSIILSHIGLTKSEIKILSDVRQKLANRRHRI
ncbi:MAG: N-6 DNA methylase [Bacteroidia bacterium]|nr:N-6 DNA methylase [Bacteroidia bacterium]